MFVPIIAPTPPPPFTPTLVARVNVVTLTVTSGSSTATSQPSSGGGSSVPIGAIAGGAAGGVTLAVLLVLIWKYWGLVIKRDERKRRKEVQDILTVRENTRRNASSGFKPQSQYRPMLALNPDRRRVKFLTRSPTASSRKKQQRAPSPVPSGSELKQRRGGAEGEAPPLTPTSAPTTANEAPRQPSPGQPLPTGAPDTERPPENNNGPRSHTELPAPTKATVSQSQPPTPTHTSTNSPVTALAAPSPARRVHIRTPSPLSVAQPLMASGSSSTPWDGHEAPTPGSSKAPPPVPTFSQPPVSTAMPPLPAGAAPPIPSPPPVHSSWDPTTRSPLRSSVLASSDRPVIMPRAKNAPWTPPQAPAPGSSSQPALPAPSRPPAPSMASPASQYSRNSGEPMTRRGFMNALRNKPSAQAGPSTNAR
ncbi:hypothetical protein V8E53_001128 [Lactarius tabidus]